MECGYKHRMLRSTEQIFSSVWLQAMMVSGDGKWSVLTGNRIEMQPKR